MRLVSLDHPPPGGFRVRYTPTGWARSGVSSFWSLVYDLVDHAVGNGYELTEPEAADLVETQTAEEVARTPRGLTHVVQQGGRLSMRSLASGAFGLLEAAAKVEAREDVLVSEEQATARAAVCRECPLNVQPDDESSLERWARERTARLVGDRITRHADLRTCGACGCELPTLVNMQLSLLEGPFAVPHNELPVACWRRTEAQPEPNTPTP